MKVGDLIEWNGRIGLVTKTTRDVITIMFSGDPPFEYLFDQQWYQWAKRKKQLIEIDQ